jgi:hypothetical protein
MRGDQDPHNYAGFMWRAADNEKPCLATSFAEPDGYYFFWQYAFDPLAVARLSAPIIAACYIALRSKTAATFSGRGAIPHRR